MMKNLYSLILAAGCLMLLVSGYGNDGSDAGNPLATGEKAKKKYPDAKSLMAAANKGDVDAQYLLGIKYKNGDGMIKDIGEAAKWFRKAAAQEYAPAQYELAMCYESLVDENGRQLDEATAARAAYALYRAAALKGYAPAQLETGLCHRETNRGTYANPHEALKWIKAAAEQGYLEAQTTLGDCYSDEWYGVNFNEAVKWYRKAAERGDSYAQLRMASAYLSGRGVERDPMESAKWARKSADQGNATAPLLVGTLYLDGYPEKNPAEALRWLKLAAEQTQNQAAMRRAKFFIGGCYEKGEGVKKDLKEALKWYYSSGDPMASQAIDRVQMEMRKGK